MKLSKSFRYLLVFVIACSFLTHAAFAGTTGKIAGKVVDAQSHEPLVGVNIILVGTSLGAATDIEGSYFIINVPPGKYELKVSGVGYTPSHVNNVQVAVDLTTRIDFTLQSQAVEMNAVEIMATRPIVQKDVTSTTSTVTADQISKLPVEDVAAVVNLQAGVVEGHFRGGRSNEVKYLIDGISVNDVFSGASTLQPEVNSLEEIQVLSGTFNAEYGEALSGVVNQVTKIAHDTYSGQISTYFGDYLSARKDLFQNINHVSPTNIRNVEGSLSGPVPGSNGALKFFVSGRYYDNDGYIYGKRMFNPSDSSNFSGNDPSQWHVGATGDGNYVSMNFNRRYSLQAKISINLGNSRIVNVQTLLQQNDYRQYDHRFQLNPDGDYKYFQKTILGITTYTHVFNESAFLDVKASAFSSDYKQYVFEDPLDSGYVKLERLRDVGGNAFLTGGTQNWHFLHHTNSYTGKLDFTDQISRIHQMKTGGEFVYHTLRYQDFQTHVDAGSNYVPTLPVPGSFDFNTYSNHPYQFAGYAQDKIELDYLIVNVGLRFDYFQPDGRTLRDPNNIAVLDTLLPPFPDSLTSKAAGKYQFSPRFGLSYPISDKGAIHISYGHFFQIPAFEVLYKNPNFRIPLSGENFPADVGSIIGNADLQPQRTTIYEIGLQQEIAPNLGITLTAFGKDIRDLLGIRLFVKNNFKVFGQYINRDYGEVRGFTIALEKRLSEGFGGNIDYTYQTANGSASDPRTALNNAQASPPIETNKELVPLDWDRRHSLNLTLTVGDEGDYIASFIGRLGSGLPYTPSLQNQRTGLENSDNRPMFFNADLYMTKYFGQAISVFVKIYNVFDAASEINVFTDTGRAGYSLELTRPQQPPRGVNTLAEYFTRPDFYSAPRQVVMGAVLSF